MLFFIDVRMLRPDVVEFIQAETLLENWTCAVNGIYMFDFASQDEADTWNSHFEQVLYTAYPDHPMYLFYTGRA